MKQTLTPNQAAQLLLQDKNANWSYNGALALCEYLEEDTEFDPVAFRCEFSEYASAFEAASDFGLEIDREEDYADRCEEEALTWLQENTIVIGFNGGIIVKEF